MKLQKIYHRPVGVHGRMAGIEKKYNKRNTATVFNIRGQQIAPCSFLFMPDSRITVTGKINKIKLPVNEKIVDQSCFSGS